MIEFDPDVRGGDGFAIARDILDSGRALAKMNAIIDAQGRRPLRPRPRRRSAPLSFEVAAPRDGVVTAIDNLRLARIARLAGAPKVAGAGVDLLHRLGDDGAGGRAAVPCACRASRPTSTSHGARPMPTRAFVSARADELPRDYVLRDNGAEF